MPSSRLSSWLVARRDFYSTEAALSNKMVISFDKVLLTSQRSRLKSNNLESSLLGMPRVCGLAVDNTGKGWLKIGAFSPLCTEGSLWLKIKTGVLHKIVLVFRKCGFYFPQAYQQTSNLFLVTYTPFSRLTTNKINKLRI